MNDNWTKIHDEMILAFRQGLVSNASEEELQAWLMNMCDGAILNDSVRHTEIIRGLTVNHIQMARVIKGVEATMERLNAANDKTQRLIIVLTYAAVGLAVIQTIAVLAPIFCK